jgi:hypothetical protein
MTSVQDYTFLVLLHFLTEFEMNGTIGYFFIFIIKNFTETELCISHGLKMRQTLWYIVERENSAYNYN